MSTIVPNTLTAADITALLAKGGHKRTNSTGTTGTPKNYWYDMDGTRHTGKAPATAVGRFTGNVGTKRRSRKGSTTTLPNGSRSYGDSWPTYTVSAYKV